MWNAPIIPNARQTTAPRMYMPRIAAPMALRWRTPSAIMAPTSPMRPADAPIEIGANGTITPAASSANADGAAALILTKRSLADRDGLPLLAEIKGHATHGQDPQWFTTAPI